MKTQIISLSKKNLFPFIIITLGILLPFIFSLNQFNFIFISLMEKGIGRSLRDYVKWSRIIKNVLHIPMLFFIFAFFVNYVNIGKTIFSDFKSTLKELFSTLKNKKNILILIITFLFLFFAYFNIVNSNFYYQDDLFRNYSGDRGWISFGRFISEFLSPFIHTTINLTDIAPLTQIISLLLMSLTLYILVYSISNKNISSAGIILFSFIFISPFYVQCFCYRFDNPYMTLAVLFSVLPFLFKDNTKTFVFSSILFLILTCMSYQSATSIYIMIVIFISLNKFLTNENKKDVFKFILISIISFILGLLIYNLLFMSKPNPAYGTPDYDYYFNTTISLKAIIPNLIAYNKIITSSFGLWEKGFILISVVLFIITSIVKSSINKILSAGLAVVFLFLAYFLTLGPYIAFTQTLLQPRVYMGFSSLIALILYFSYVNIKSLSSVKRIKLLYIPLFCVIYGSITFLYTFGNCLKQQNEYQNFRIKNMISDLNELTTTSKPTIELKGNVGYCKTIDLAVEKYPVIRQLLVPMPGNNGFWDEDMFYFYNFVFEKSEIESELQLLKSTYYHDIYGDGNNFIIELKDINECL